MGSAHEAIDGMPDQAIFAQGTGAFNATFFLLLPGPSLAAVDVTKRLVSRIPITSLADQTRKST
jgi:hypothetical protein